MAAAPTTAKPAGKKKLIVLIVIALASIGGGAAVPMLLAKPADHGEAKPAKKHAHTVNVPFGEVVVNLAEDRMTRYLRIKITLKVEGPHEDKEGVEHLAKFRPMMKSWLITHLTGKSLKDVSGTLGIKRLQREILEKFEELLTEGDDHGHGANEHFVLRDVCFEEYIVQ